MELLVRAVSLPIKRPGLALVVSLGVAVASVVVLFAGAPS